MDTDPDPAFRLNTDPDIFRIQGFDDQKLEKFTAKKKILDKYKASIKDVQVTEEAFSSQKRTSSTENYLILNFRGRGGGGLGSRPVQVLDTRTRVSDRYRYSFDTDPDPAF